MIMNRINCILHGESVVLSVYRLGILITTLSSHALLTEAPKVKRLSAKKKQNIYSFFAEWYSLNYYGSSV